MAIGGLLGCLYLLIGWSDEDGKNIPKSTKVGESIRITEIKQYEVILV
jgi:hypothetical protein